MEVAGKLSMETETPIIGIGIEVMIYFQIVINCFRKSPIFSYVNQNHLFPYMQQQTSAVG